MLLLKKTVAFLFLLLIIHQLNFAQKNIKPDVPGTSAKSLSSNVQIFFYVGVFEKSVAHMIWENYDEANIREVILESSNDGNFFTTCSRAEISSLPDIHLINYPKELEYNNIILKSSEHGGIRYIFNDENKNFDFSVHPKWYRLKMLTFSGYTYISQIICTKNIGEIIKENVAGITFNDENATSFKETSGYSWLPANKAGCSPVGTPPSGYTITNTHQYVYGDNCCYNKLTLYEGPVIPSVNQCGNYGIWCCDNVPEAASCPSGYAEDPCCVHPCGQYNQCSCQPWQCCQGQHAQAWVITELGQAGTPSIPAPTASPAGVCGSGTTTLSASSAGYEIYWYTGSCGGTFVSTGSQISVTVSATTTFYARAWSASCGVSDCGTVTVQVYPLPGAVTVNGGGTQCGGSRTLTASGGTTGTIYWQGTTSGGASTATPSTSQVVSTSGTYYFRSYSVNGCWGPQGSATVTINQIPADPAPVANPATICSGGTTSLSATVANSKIYWYTGSCGGTLIGSGSPITVTIGATTTFYARAYNVTTGCWSVGCGSVTVSMGTVSTPAPIASPPGICGSGSSSLTATVPGATLYWYSGSCGGTLLGTGNTVTVSPTTTTTYYVRALSGSCAPSACGTVTVTIGTPVTQTITGTTPICVGATSTFTGTTSGGTWTSSAPGVAAVDPSTGVITGVSAGTSVIAYSVTTGGCVNTATKSVTITASVPQVLSGTTLLCAGSTSTWTSTTSGGSWTSGSIDIVTVNSSTGLVTAIGPGTTVITYSVTTGGGCINTATMSVTVNHPAVVNISGGTSPICSNSNPGTFTATAISGNGTYTYQWHTTSSIINGATNSTFNPGNITDTTGYYCEVTSGICGAVNSNTLTINVFPQLTADPIPDTSICTKTSPGTFTANVHGGTGPYSYLWYWDGTSTGVTSSTYNPGIIQTNANFHCVITNTCGTLTTPVIHVTIISPVGNPSPITVGGGTEPVCQLTNGTTTTTYATNAPNATGYNWSISNPAAGSIDANGVMTWTNGFYGTVDIEVTANGCDGPSIMVTRTVTVNLCGTGHNISGKTRYCGKANNGNPIPNPPTYN
ncbi:MAG TPA: hypothetical protein PKW80_08780, partial [Bacteroidales bacterium]|nr:hypothetical protein [Bacteroidales bacterium]